MTNEGRPSGVTLHLHAGFYWYLEIAYCSHETDVFPLPQHRRWHISKRAPRIKVLRAPPLRHWQPASPVRALTQDRAAGMSPPHTASPALAPQRRSHRDGSARRVMFLREKLLSFISVSQWDAHSKASQRVLRKWCQPPELGRGCYRKEIAEEEAETFSKWEIWLFRITVLSQSLFTLRRANVKARGRPLSSGDQTARLECRSQRGAPLGLAVAGSL